MRYIDREVRRAVAAFQDRAEAGARLARFVLGHGFHPEVVLAVPRGGVAMAAPLAQAAGAPLHALVVRKLPIPWSPEAGFGAVTLDGRLVLNEPMVQRLGLGREDIEAIGRQVLAEVRRRQTVYGAPPGEAVLQGRRVCVVDDGLASGYTMIAGLEMLRASGAAAVAVAVADAPLEAIALVEPHADAVFCLVAQRGGSFAVASYFRDFHDLSDAEVLDLLHASSRPSDPASGRAGRSA